MNEKPPLKIEYRPVDTLIPYARNARTHSPEQVDQICKSMERFGFTNPILLDTKNMILAGHGRLMAAEKIGLKTVPTIMLVGLSAAEKRAYILADNKIAINAGYDLDLLRLELGELGDLGFDLSLTGFDAGELTDIFAVKAGNTDPDDVPDLAVVAVSKPGDVWLLGPHRLVCGDSTTPESVALALKGQKPKLMVTDPPYGVEYDADWRNHASRADDGSWQRTGTKGARRVLGAKAVGVVENDDRADWTAAWKLFAGDVAYVWHADRHVGVVLASLERASFELRSQIIWAKQQFAIGRGHYHHQHEPCFYAVRKGATGHWEGGRKQSTLWAIDKPQKSETGHSTQKPVECMKRPIENNSKPGESVYEPFMGSGTTLIAAEMAGRVALGIEISPQYVDLAVRRWQAFTAKDAKLESTGDTFAQVERKRLKGAAAPAKAKTPPRKKAAKKAA